MSRWQVSIEATITISVEADTENQALEAALTTLTAKGIGSQRFKEAVRCSVGNVLATRDEQTGVDLPK